MIPDPLTLHPTYHETQPCETFECHYRAYRLEDCRDRHCPFMGERRETAARATRDLADEKESR